ncbi:hypothetical protein V494_05383 [Pseudogymnoascus sp. VKM F-4513 (FW-928)]|nr:hypothetical protein V494_05383 [Pseudogymnoascus sp. VKM F-4513 (FW-928)]
MDLSPEQLAALDAESKGPTTLVVVIFFTILSFVFVCMRYVSRFAIIKRGSAEDYTIGAAMIVSIGMAACMIEQVKYGNGRHAALLKLDNFIGILKYLYFSILAYCTALTLTKMSILLQLRRIFGVNKSMHYATLTMMVVVMAYGIESVTIGIFTCTPVRAYWDLKIQASSRCLPQDKVYYANGGLNIATDLIIATLPIYSVWKLQIDIRQKIALMVVLALGWFVCFVSILRLQALVVLYRHPEDTTWYSPETAYWSCIEVNVGIICACAPAIRPVLVRIVPRIFGTPAYGSGEPSSNAHPAFIELGHKKSIPSTGTRSYGARPSSRNELQESGGRKGFGRLEKPLPMAPSKAATRTNINRDSKQTFWRGDEDSDGYNNGAGETLPAIDTKWPPQNYGFKSFDRRRSDLHKFWVIVELIRYAAAPIGPLRWQAPQAPANNRTVIPATQLGPICPQSYPSVPDAPFIPGDEDCLFLNVYAPSNALKQPVLVWIHGGGYGYGDASQDMTEIIAANNNGFVVVSLQYRLGAFGFLSSAEVKSKGAVNAGLLDQDYALKWIQKNIHLFGGDKRSVTIAGNSAGAGSVMYHALTGGGTAGTALFQNAIVSSPYLPVQNNFDDEFPTRRFYDFSVAAGCPSSGDVFDCLVTKDSMTLQQASNQISTTQTYGTWAFLPVTDGTFVKQLPSKQLLAKNVNGKNILVGSNANEGALFVPPTISTEADLIAWLHLEFPNVSDDDVTQILAAYPSSPDPVNPDDPMFATTGLGPATAVNVSQVATGQQQRGNNIYAEATFVCPSYWLASAYTGNGRKAYKYQYSVPFGSHTDDLPAAFGPAQPNHSDSFVAAFRNIWGKFVTSSNPSISTALADGGQPTISSAPNPVTNFPAWTESSPQQINLNITGGTPYTTVTMFGATVTQFQEPGLKNAFSVADANAWEGGRGTRCDFWRTIAERVPM